MKYRPLGRTGQAVSVICLGTMTWGDQNTAEEGFAQMDLALESGVTFFDTAELYPSPPKAETQGNTERIIGEWFQSRGTRDKVILAGKVVGSSGMTWFRDGGAQTKLTRPQMTEALDKSLKRLKTDYIDLYQLHWPQRPIQWGSNPTAYQPFPMDAPLEIEEQLSVLGDFIRAGKIRWAGLSNESAWGAMTFLKESDTRGLPRMQSIQNAYSLLNRTFETGLAEIAMREHLGLLAYSPMAQGYLSGKYRDGALPPGSRKALYDRLQRYEKPGSSEAVDAYVALAARHGLDPGRMALSFVNSRPFLTSTIIGASSLPQLRNAIASIDLAMPPELEAEINAIHQVHLNPAC